MATYNPTGTSGIGSPGTTGTTSTTGTSQSPLRSEEQTLRDREGRLRGSSSEDLGEKIGEKVGGVTGAIGNRLERAGDYFEDKGKAAFLSERLHGAGRYLQENDVKSMARSMDSAICAHPYRGILIGLGLGWVVGRFLSRGE